MNIISNSILLINNYFMFMKIYLNLIFLSNKFNF